MSWKRVLFIFNPVAGKSQIRNDLMDIIQIFTDHGYEVVCYPTKGAGDALKIVRERKDDYLYIVCAGGDGTLDEVVSGMMQNPDKPFVPIGYIPAGTTNDFASSLGIPTGMVEAARVVAEGRTYLCDLGQLNRDNYFVYVAAFGLFTETSYQTPQDLKNVMGHFAYILQGVTELGKLRSYRVHVESKEISVTDDFAYCMISNSHSVGGFSNITGNDVDLSDGLFEVTLIRMPKTLIDVNSIIMYLGQRVEDSDMVFHFKTDHITFTSQEEISWTRDGEYGGTYKETEIVNCPQAMKILVPRERVRDREIRVIDEELGDRNLVV